MAVCASLVGKDNDLLLCPLLVSRQSSQGCGLVAVRFGLSLVPGAQFLPFEQVSPELLLLMWRKGDLTR